MKGYVTLTRPPVVKCNKKLLSQGSLSGREISKRIGLPLKIFSDLLYDLKQRLILACQVVIK